jgi:hypothetical protein
MLTPLTLSNLGGLANGEAELVCNAALRRAVEDTEDRGTDGQTRTVTITVTMRKANNGMVAVDLAASSKVPGYRTNTTLARARAGEAGGLELAYQQEAPDNPDQLTIPYPAAAGAN